MKINPNDLDLHERDCGVVQVVPFPCDCNGRKIVEEVSRLAKMADDLNRKSDVTSEQLLGLLTETRAALSDSRDHLSAWRFHVRHIEKGVHGCEKTIGLDFFDPRKHCDVCGEEWKHRRPILSELEPRT